MDPVSILGAVDSVGGAVISLSTRLYSFIQAAKVVDKSVEALYCEVKGLESVLNVSQTFLAETVKAHAKYPALSLNGAWTSIDNGVQDCRITVKALDSLVQNVGSIAGTTNPFKKMFKQIKLNLSTDQIVAVRARVHTHGICLQLALQTLSVVLSFSSMTGINNTVIPSLEVITSKFDVLSSGVARLNLAQNSENVQLPEHFQNPHLQDHTQRLKRSANKVLTTASTLLGGSSAREDDSQYIPTTFSEFGVPLDNARRAGIEEWTRDLVIGIEESTTESSENCEDPSTSTDQNAASSKVHNSVELDDSPDVVDIEASRRRKEAEIKEAEPEFHAIAAERIPYQGRSKLNDDVLKPKLREKGSAEWPLVTGQPFDSKPAAEHTPGRTRSNAKTEIPELRYLERGAEHVPSKRSTQAKFRGEGVRPIYAREFAEEILLALDCNIHSIHFDTTHALGTVVAKCDGTPIGPGQLAKRFTPVPTQIAASVEHLYSMRADINALNDDGWAPLHVAAKRGDLAIATTLCELGADLDLAGGGYSSKIALHIAAEKGHTALVVLLLERGAFVDTKDSAKLTPLHMAAFHNGQLDVVKVLCDAGADFEARSELGTTPLMFSIRAVRSNVKNTLEIVRELCERGADVPELTGEFSVQKDVKKVLNQYQARRKKDGRIPRRQ